MQLTSTAHVEYFMLEPHHVSNCKVLHRKEALYELMPKNAIVAEIGVLHGKNALKIYSISKPKHLYLIDNNVLEQTKINLNEKNITFIEGDSSKVLEAFDDIFFDWVYLDASHTYESVSRDLNILKNKVKPHGRICGHDYVHRGTEKYFGVIPAVNEFCHLNDWEFEYFTLDSHSFFSFCLKKCNTAHSLSMPVQKERA